jgi:hypothetical protein
MADLGLTLPETQASINTIWDPNKPAKLQFFAWQVASGGLFTGSRAIHLGYHSVCVCCRSSLVETVEHCLYLCKFARRPWKWAANFRSTFGLNLGISWRELISGIRPDVHCDMGYRPHNEAPLMAWDVFRVALLWCIWCARCKVIFETFIVTHVCQLAWLDTIHVGMARWRSFQSPTQVRTEANFRSIASEFIETWYKGQVFCSGSLSSPRWNFFLFNSI